MISDPNGSEMFSADVKLHLYVGTTQIELGQLGPGFALLRIPQNIDATEGEIETIVDNKTTRHRVRITSPITTASRRFTFEPV